MRAPRENRTRERRDDDDRPRSSEDQTVSKQTSRCEGMTEVRERAEHDTTDVSSADRHEKQSSRQRLRYKVGGLLCYRAT